MKEGDYKVFPGAVYIKAISISLSRIVTNPYTKNPISCFEMCSHFLIFSFLKIFKCSSYSKVQPCS